MWITVQNVIQCETDCQKFVGFDAVCSNFDFSGTHVLTSKQIKNLEKCLCAHKNYLWLKRILSLVLLILYSMRFIWNKILFYIHIAPLSRSYLPCKWNSFPITSPILLVAKRKSNGSHVDQSKEAHLTSYRFCFDFRYLNSQTLNFSYNIPDVQ